MPESSIGGTYYRPLHFNAKTAKRIMAIDCGISNTLIRLLMSFNIRLRIVPWDYDIFSEPWDGLLVSSGPDCHPSLCEATVNNLKRALALEPPKPIMGIGLGMVSLYHPSHFSHEKSPPHCKPLCTAGEGGVQECALFFRLP